MSDLAATNCGCGEERSGCGCGNCGCNNGCGCDNGCGLSFGNGSFAHAAATVLAATTAVATEMVTAAGSLSSFCFSAVDGGMAAAADLSFPHMKKGCLLSPFQKKSGQREFSPVPFFRHILKAFLRFLVSFSTTLWVETLSCKLSLIPGMVCGLPSFF